VKEGMDMRNGRRILQVLIADEVAVEACIQALSKIPQIHEA